MIKFFRQIRQRLLSESKFSKYLIYALGEIILVVIGILIALQVNNWNQERHQKATESIYLTQLLEETKADSIFFQSRLTLFEMQGTCYSQLIQVCEGTLNDSLLASTPLKNERPFTMAALGSATLKSIAQDGDKIFDPTIKQSVRHYEQALKDGDFEIVHSAFGRNQICKSSKIQSTYKIFGDAKIVEQYRNIDVKNKFRFSMSSHNSNIDEDEAFFVATGKRDEKIYTMALFIHYNRSSWEGLTDNIFVQAIIVEKEDMDTGQVSAASIEEKIKNEGKEVFHNILFDFGSDNLTVESFGVIETLAEYLNNNKNNKYYIVGHTDNVGSLASNQTLSMKRAKAVMTALTNKYGVTSDQISAHGVGQLSPIMVNTTEEGRALNRRVEVVLR